MIPSLVPWPVCAMLSGVNPLAFDDLKRLPVIEFYEEAFRKATAPAYDVFYAKFGDKGKKIIEAIRGM